MRLKHGDQAKIAKELGLKPSTICDILRGRIKKPSPEFAAYIEKNYGIDRRAWLYPDEFPNPLINGKKHEAENGDAQN